jgi:hypothetical protein
MKRTFFTVKIKFFVPKRQNFNCFLLKNTLHTQNLTFSLIKYHLFCPLIPKILNLVSVFRLAPHKYLKLTQNRVIQAKNRRLFSTKNGTSFLLISPFIFGLNSLGKRKMPRSSFIFFDFYWQLR